VYDIEAAYLAAALGSQNPYLRQSLLLDVGGYRRVSKIMPSVVYNTINVPIFPDRGQRYSASFELAGPGGNTYYQKMRFEGIWYIPMPKYQRLTLGMRAEGQWISPRGVTVLPIFEKFFIGGEYTVRGFDMRTIGPRDSVTGIVTGGNKTLVFNAELAFRVAGPVRIIGFFDAGQVRDVGERFGWMQDHVRAVPFDRGILYDPFTSTILTEEPYVPQTEVWARSHAFKTSTGLELRFFMPVLNVPFRLIGAWNPSRFGVFNNNLEPTKQFTFRFAVGTTF
jgi:outer membrane protein assembly factor BamA